jgi:hypothetical protein
MTLDTAALELPVEEGRLPYHAAFDAEHLLKQKQARLLEMYQLTPHFEDFTHT